VRVANGRCRTALRWAANVTRSHLHISPFLGESGRDRVLMIRNPLSWRPTLTQRRTLGCSSQAIPHGKTWQDSSRRFFFCGVIYDVFQRVVPRNAKCIMGCSLKRMQRWFLEAFKRSESVVPVSRGSGIFQATEILLSTSSGQKYLKCFEIW
jgi:hypothetical protein